MGEGGGGSAGAASDDAAVAAARQLEVHARGRSAAPTPVRIQYTSYPVVQAQPTVEAPLPVDCGDPRGELRRARCSPPARGAHRRREHHRAAGHHRVERDGHLSSPTRRARWRVKVVAGGYEPFTETEATSTAGAPRSATVALDGRPNVTVGARHERSPRGRGEADGRSSAVAGARNDASGVVQNLLAWRAHRSAGAALVVRGRRDSAHHVDEIQIPAAVPLRGPRPRAFNKARPSRASASSPATSASTHGYLARWPSSRPR